MGDELMAEPTGEPASAPRHWVLGDQVVSQGRTVTESDLRVWAGLVHDFTPLHVDHQTMEESFFGRPVAHGYIALNLAVGLMFPGLADWYAPDHAVLTIGWADVRFLAPVHPGDTLRCRRTVRAVGSDTAEHLVEMVNQDDTVVVSGIEILAAC
jgi:acyl dehydratase